MMETNCISAGIIQPVEPNCGLVEATESMPKRMHVGPAAQQHEQHADHAAGRQGKATLKEIQGNNRCIRR